MVASWDVLEMRWSTCPSGRDGPGLIGDERRAGGTTGEEGAPVIKRRHVVWILAQHGGDRDVGMRAEDVEHGAPGDAVGVVDAHEGRFMGIQQRVDLALILQEL